MTIASRLQYVIAQIHAAEKKYQRPLGCVKLLAVSKGRSVEHILKAFESGQIAFAESYVQEALAKQITLRDYPIEWHFIGNIQSNKTKLIAENFSWVHSVNRSSIAEKLNQYRPARLPPLNVCIEVNMDQDPHKSGIMPEQVFELALAIRSLPNLVLRGCMVIPALTTDLIQQEKIFKKAADLQQRLIQQGFLLDTLSMGMSHDFEMAIKTGGTLVRIGTAIFQNN